MANQYFHAGKLDQAEPLYKQVLADDPQNIRVLISLTLLYQRSGDARLSAQYRDQAVAAQPIDVADCIALGNFCKSWGRFDRARECFRQALEQEPENADAYLAMAESIRSADNSDEVAQFEEFYQRTEPGSYSRRKLAFALGRICDDLGLYDKAFRYFDEGNRIVKSANPSAIDDPFRMSQAIKKIFDSGFFERYADVGIDDALPVFIFGLPRSGTTLVEQILASHPRVHGAGELGNFNRIVTELGNIIGSAFPLGFDEIEPDLLRKMAVRYVAELSALATSGATYVTNKNLGAVLYVGLITVMLPKARLVYCERDPRDQALSFFQKDFDAQQPYSYDLADIGKYSRSYRDTADQWKYLLPDKILHVQYEQLVEDSEHNIRKLLEFCGLQFDPVCLSFHQTERMVLTASDDQVRQPIYSKSIGRWKNYVQQLRPLLDELQMDD